ncbi:hypothetical protein LAJPDJIK_01196 [Aeromonas salmonicida]
MKLFGVELTKNPLDMFCWRKPVYIDTFYEGIFLYK